MVAAATAAGLGSDAGARAAGLGGETGKVGRQRSTSVSGRRARRSRLDGTGLAGKALLVTGEVVVTVFFARLEAEADVATAAAAARVAAGGRQETAIVPNGGQCCDSIRGATSTLDDEVRRTARCLCQYVSVHVPTSLREVYLGFKPSDEEQCPWSYQS